MGMKSTVTNAAEISVLQPIDNNYKTGGGDISVGGALVIASKGKPFTPKAIYGGTTDIQDIFGLPLPKKATGMEGLRHVHDASESCSFVNVVRVVDTLTYRYPSLTFLSYNDSGNKWAPGQEFVTGDVVTYNGVKYLCVNSHTSNSSVAPSTDGQTDWLVFESPVVNGKHRYNEEIVVDAGAFMCLYPIDGDPSVNRYVEISNIDEEAERFTISVFDKDELGEPYEVESYTVGVGEDDKDDMGVSAYVETVFETHSDRFRVDFMEGLTWADILPALKGIETTRTVTNDYKFVGGTAGNEPDVQDWKLGVEVFRNDRVACNLLFAAGIYEPDVLVDMAKVADERHIAFFYDTPPALKYAEAIAWDKAMGLTCRHARAYYSPYSANDQWRGGKCVWGVSGAMAAAKARCNATITRGVTPGVHYAPAGEGRSYLTRTGLEALFPEDRLNRDELYDARINPIVPITSGGCGSDDDLTHWFKTNYLRFGWINDVLDYIDHRFYEGAQQVKFEPDGLTQRGLMDMMVAIMEELVTSEALVAPRDPARDGTAPYVIKVEQLEIDLWKVTWEVCITGAARRIVGQPKLIK